MQRVGQRRTSTNVMMTVMMMMTSIRRRSISDQEAKCCYTNLNGDNAESNCEVPPIAIQIGAREFQSLVVSPVGAMQNNMLDTRANPTNGVSHQGMRKTPEEHGHARVDKNRPTRGQPWKDWGSTQSWRLGAPFSFFPSLVRNFSIVDISR